MDFAALLAQSAARREFDVPFRGAVFRLRMQTPFEHRRIAYSNVGPDGRFDFAQVERQTVLTAVIGWTGVTAADIFGPEAGSEPVEFSQEALGALLDLRLDVLDALAAPLQERLRATKAAVDAEKKP